MAGDYQQKPRAANYFDQLLVNDPHKLMRKYSVKANNEIGGYRGTDAATFAGARDDNTAIAHRKMAADKKVAYVTLTRTPRGQIVVTGNEGGDTIFLDGQYAPAAHLVPIWFLPWDYTGAVIELIIPAKGTVNAPDPDIFFTAAINGCSIFFRGTPKNPVVYHCGGDTLKGSDHVAAAGFWRGLMMNNVLGQNVLAPGMKEVNKTDYVRQPGYQNSTAAAEDYRRWLKSHSSNRVQVRMVNPWGCVMGIRDPAGNWKFFLQENVTVIYKVLKKKAIGMKTEKEQKIDTAGQPIAHHGVNVVVEKERYVSRPLITREVFPNSVTGGAHIPRPIPDLVHG